MYSYDIPLYSLCVINNIEGFTSTWILMKYMKILFLVENIVISVKEY